MAHQADQTTKLPAPGIQRSLSAQRDRPRPSNLPLPLTSLVGRTEALAAIQRLLNTTRLLTLSGPGGVGKTRLALEAAFALSEEFEDGVWWVDLAPLCDAELVAHAVALVLGLQDDPTRSKVATLGDYLLNQHVLLVFDNCEHLIAECADLAGQLLHASARLHILATSREPLGIDGETVWPVPPLSLPCIEETPTIESVTHSEAGQLFLERARAIEPGFPLTEASVRAIAQVCCRLDGIPLAIELAAARVRVLSVPEIAAHLDDRFRLLTGGSRTALPRHQTLKAAIDWSYDLLTDSEQQLFRWLAVFAGGFTLKAAEAVASDLAGRDAIPPAGVLDLLSHLVTKSLIVVQEGPQTRYRMLDTIRLYAWEQLLAAGELERMRQWHLAYYLDLARRAEPKLRGEEQVQWLNLLEVEHDNLRAALAWSQEGETGELGLHLAATLAAFWIRAGYLSEGSGWLDRALAGCHDVRPVCIRAFFQAGRLAQQRGEYEHALAFAQQSLVLSRHLEDRQGTARALGLMGWVAHWQGDRDGAGPLLEEGLTLSRESNDDRATAQILLFLGDLRLRQGAHEQAAALLQESLALFQRMSDGWRTAWALGGLGAVAWLQGDYEGAVALLQSSLSLHQKLGTKADIPYPLEALALVAADLGHSQRAVCLWGAASGIRDSTHSFLPPSYKADSAPYMEKVRAILGAEAFGAAWSEGHALSIDQAILLATAVQAAKPASPANSSTDVGAPAQPPPQPHVYGLTPREVEVLRQVACGLTDVQIAEMLSISPRTVGKHLQSIYSKLDIPSRSAATRWAMEHHLD